MTNFMTFLSRAIIVMAFALPAFAGHHMNHDKKDIVDTAASNDSFSTLVTAVKAAGLVDVLKGDGPFTVFAPTNEAFDALPAGTLESLLKPENKDTLKQVLTYHVISDKVPAKTAMQINRATTVEGSDITLMTSNGSVMVNNATVIKADIMASNGVIHVIDKVILPAKLMASL